MKILVVGAGGYIGKALAARLQKAGNEVTGTTRKELDLLDMGDLDRFGDPDVVYLCAGKTRFIECEDDPTAYRINVDAQVALERHFKDSDVIFLSSEAVERALHTNYGMHKALAEAAMRDCIIARICGKVTDATLPDLCAWLEGLLGEEYGVHRWVP